ncbi:MAG: NAD(P)-dependent oxidoreductase, partial [Gemmataceae bacterium]|nr:NAD(P)-dependent oxidoreductase [Gemmataceae bacterium]
AEDAANALVALARSELTGPVNVGSGEGVAVREVIGHVARACGRPELVRLGERETPATEPPLLVADVSRLRDELNWRPRVALGDGLRATANWWRANRAA